MDGKHTGLVKDITAPVPAKLSHKRSSDLPLVCGFNVETHLHRQGVVATFTRQDFSVRQARGYGHLTPSMKH